MNNDPTSQLVMLSNIIKILLPVHWLTKCHPRVYVPYYRDSKLTREQYESTTYLNPEKIRKLPWAVSYIVIYISRSSSTVVHVHPIIAHSIAINCNKAVTERATSHYLDRWWHVFLMAYRRHSVSMSSLVSVVGRPVKRLSKLMTNKQTDNQIVALSRTKMVYMFPSHCVKTVHSFLRWHVIPYFSYIFIYISSRCFDFKADVSSRMYALILITLETQPWLPDFIFGIHPFSIFSARPVWAEVTYHLGTMWFHIYQLIGTSTFR